VARRVTRELGLRCVAVAASVAALVSLGASALPPAARQSAASGAIEGQIVLPKGVVTRTAERYVSTTGEPRDIPRIPVIVHVEGPVGPASARPSGAMSLTQRGEMFDQYLLVVPLGASVAFPNADPVFHNVFSYSRAKRFDLGRYRQGESKSVAFDKPGYIKVMCEVHKWMRAGIVVVENPYYAIVADTGHFRIEGVPAGRHRVAVEHFDRRPHVAEVDVPAAGVVRFDVKL
jgi:plastocyanin